MNQNNIHYLAGKQNINTKPLQPFDDTVCLFLNELSKKLRKDKTVVKYTDIISFAFWCRKSNIENMKQVQKNSLLRIGRGLIFHIAPSNVPINFAFSYVFGLLAGNANIVRVSSKEFRQVNIICNVLNELFADEKFRKIAEGTQIVSYEHDDEINQYFSSICDGRVIWGGDNTINELRKFPISSRCVEINFADRYSMGIVSTDSIINMSDEELQRLAENFYNDTYLMDQNACSSPHIIIWKKDNADVMKAQKRFWDCVAKCSGKYVLADIKVSEKFSKLCQAIVNFDEIANVYRYENLLYIINLSKISEPLDKYRGIFGMFYQYEIDQIDELIPFVNSPKIQTLAVSGIKTSELAEFIVQNGIKGIDRIVPFGKTLDIGTVWDGYNIIDTLSRIISFTDK